MSEEILLTQEGYDKIVAEHEELVSVKRKEVSERLKEAISYGDLSENSEYDSAKNEQAELEERILKLENMIRKAKIINESEMDADRVSVGLKVKVQGPVGEGTKAEAKELVRLAGGDGIYHSGIYRSRSFCRQDLQRIGGRQESFRQAKGRNS